MFAWDRKGLILNGRALNMDSNWIHVRDVSNSNFKNLIIKANDRDTIELLEDIEFIVSDYPWKEHYDVFGVPLDKALRKCENFEEADTYWEEVKKENY